MSTSVRLYGDKDKAKTMAHAHVARMLADFRQFNNFQNEMNGEPLQQNQRRHLLYDGDALIGEIRMRTCFGVEVVDVLAVPPGLQRRPAPFQVPTDPPPEFYVPEFATSEQETQGLEVPIIHREEPERKKRHEKELEFPQHLAGYAICDIDMYINMEDGNYAERLLSVNFVKSWAPLEVSIFLDHVEVGANEEPYPDFLYYLNGELSEDGTHYIHAAVPGHDSYIINGRKWRLLRVEKVNVDNFEEADIPDDAFAYSGYDNCERTGTCSSPSSHLFNPGWIQTHSEMDVNTATGRVFSDGDPVVCLDGYWEDSFSEEAAGPTKLWCHTFRYWLLPNGDEVDWLTECQNATWNTLHLTTVNWDHRTLCESDVTTNIWSDNRRERRSKMTSIGLAAYVGRDSMYRESWSDQYWVDETYYYHTDSVGRNRKNRLSDGVNVLNIDSSSDSRTHYTIDFYGSFEGTKVTLELCNMLDPNFSGSLDWDSSIAPARGNLPSVGFFYGGSAQGNQTYPDSIPYIIVSGGQSCTLLYLDADREFVEGVGLTSIGTDSKGVKFHGDYFPIYLVFEEIIDTEEE